MRLLARAPWITAAALALAALPALTHAAGPMPKGQAPGWYRMMLVDFEVTALSDGTVPLPWDKIMNAPAARIQAALARQYLKAPLETSVNGYLVNTGSKLVLIDAGAANLFGPTLGRLAKNLEEIWSVDESNSIELTRGEWEARDLHRRFTEMVLRPLRPFL